MAEKDTLERSVVLPHEQAIHYPAVRLVRSFHAIRFPWLHHSEFYLPGQTLDLEEPLPSCTMPSPESEMLVTGRGAYQMSKLLTEYYRPIGMVLAKQNIVVHGQTIRSVLHTVPYQEYFDADYQPAEVHTLDAILPADHVLESMHLIGQQRACPALIDFVMNQLNDAAQDQRITV